MQKDTGRAHPQPRSFTNAGMCRGFQRCVLLYTLVQSTQPVRRGGFRRQELGAGRQSRCGVAHSANHKPISCGAGVLSQATSGIWTRCFSRFMAIATTSGEPWIKVAMGSIFWFSVGATRPLRRHSSASCIEGDPIRCCLITALACNKLTTPR